jgi:hypothetical protein
VQTKVSHSPIVKLNHTFSENVPFSPGTPSVAAPVDESDHSEKLSALRLNKYVDSSPVNLALSSTYSNAKNNIQMRNSPLPKDSTPLSTHMPVSAYSPASTRSYSSPSSAKLATPPPVSVELCLVHGTSQKGTLQSSPSTPGENVPNLSRTSPDILEVRVKVDADLLESVSAELLAAQESRRILHGPVSVKNSPIKSITATPPKGLDKSNNKTPARRVAKSDADHALASIVNEAEVSSPDKSVVDPKQTMGTIVVLQATEAKPSTASRLGTRHVLTPVRRSTRIYRHAFAATLTRVLDEHLQRVAAAAANIVAKETGSPIETVELPPLSMMSNSKVSPKKSGTLLNTSSKVRQIAHALEAVVSTIASSMDNKVLDKTVRFSEVSSPEVAKGKVVTASPSSFVNSASKNIAFSPAKRVSIRVEVAPVEQEKEEDIHLSSSEENNIDNLGPRTRSQRQKTPSRTSQTTLSSTLKKNRNASIMSKQSSTKNIDLKGKISSNFDGVIRSIASNVTIPADSLADVDYAWMSNPAFPTLPSTPPLQQVSTSRPVPATIAATPLEGARPFHRPNSSIASGRSKAQRILSATSPIMLR